MLGSEMERFAARSAERFPFLATGKLKDDAGVRPGQPGYNPRTLMLPPNWFKTAKVIACCACSQLLPPFTGFTEDAGTLAAGVNCKGFRSFTV